MKKTSLSMRCGFHAAQVRGALAAPLAAALCATAAIPAHAGMFRDGDRVVFFGDSITAGGGYHRYLSDYYVTRCPDADIRFFNAGSGGDNSHHAATRLEDDVAAHRPTAVSVMFGMNDFGVRCYNETETEDDLREQAKRIADYRVNMAALLDLCAGTCPDAALYLLTPTPYDDASVEYEYNGTVHPNHPGANAGIGNCAAAVREEAAKRGATLVDLYTAINDAFRERRRQDPGMTFSGDRVHVCPGIHLLMAMSFLEAQNADRVVSDVALREGRCLKAIKAEVSDIVTNEAGAVSFTVLEQSLPMPFDNAAKAFTNAPAVAAFNQQLLAFYCLGDGDWTLKIDGAEVCTASAIEWERGVNLAFNEKTPQHRQAMAVMRANAARAHKAYIAESSRRGLRRDFRDQMTREGLDPEKAEDREAFLEKRLPTLKSWDVEPWKGTVKEWDDQEQLLAECEAAWADVRALAKPVPHKYELSRKESPK